MYEQIFAEPKVLILGGITGFIFGFLLQKGGVTRFSVILGQFLWKDFTVLKVMGTAIVVGAIGIYGMRAMGLDFPMHIKSATLLGNAAGGLIFGVGMAVLGYCPGTAVAAAGDGSRHALFGILGGIAGAGLYAEAHPWVLEKLLGAVNLDKVTIAQEVGLSPWWIIALLALGAAVGYYMLERKERRAPTPG